jgi:hypothetical protein
MRGFEGRIALVPHDMLSLPMKKILARGSYLEKGFQS